MYSDPHPFEPVALLHAAIKDVQPVLETKLASGLAGGQLHRALSKEWIAALSRASQRLFHNAKVRSRAPGFEPEIMLDVVVGEVATATSPIRGRKVSYFQKLVLAIESEFSRDGAHALYDFQKLLMTSASNRLFIGSSHKNASRFLDFLKPCARQCTSGLSVALISHPDEWHKGIDFQECWSWHEGDWVPAPESLTSET